MNTKQIAAATDFELLHRYGDLVHVTTKASLKERNRICKELARRHDEEQSAA